MENLEKEKAISKLNEEITNHRMAIEKLQREIGTLKKNSYNCAIGNVYNFSDCEKIMYMYVMDVTSNTNYVNVVLHGPMVILNKDVSNLQNGDLNQEFTNCNLFYDGRFTINPDCITKYPECSMEEFKNIYKIAVQMMNATFLPILDTFHPTLNRVISDSEDVELKLQ